MPKSANDVIKLAKETGAKIVDLRFIDLPGMWQHFSIPVEELNEDLFDEGIGFDGSSIRGFQQINESDMLLVPDPETVYLDPCLEIPTLSIICDVRDPVSGKPYSRDPRYIVQKAEAYLKSTGIAETSYWGPELEFYIFDNIQYDQNAFTGYYRIDSDEGIWNTGRDEKPNLGYKIRHKEGYFPVPPTDQQQDLRSEIIMNMMKVGIPIEVHHHEVGTAGQGEIDMRFSPLKKMADNVMYYKYILRNTVRKHGKVATFMPKPLFGDNGSGMHVHQSLWKGDTNLFFDTNGYSLLSQTALWYIGGLLKHAPALLALCAPTTNSYRRLVPGYEAPVNLAYSQRNRSAAVRIPVYSKSPKSKRLEFRCPDPLVQPLPVLLGAANGRSGRCPEQDRSRRAAGKGSLRTGAGGSREDQEHAGLAGRGAYALEKDHGFLLKGECLHQGPDRYLDLVQAGTRAGAGQPAPRALRVLPLL